MIEASDALVAAGHRSEIFAGDVDPRWAAKGARHYQEYGRAGAGPTATTGSSTRSRSVRPWPTGSSTGTRRSSPTTTTSRRCGFCRRGTRPRRTVWCGGAGSCSASAGRSALGIADSRFNQLDLEAAGFAEIGRRAGARRSRVVRSRCRRGAARNGCAMRRPTAAATGSSSAASLRTSASTTSSPRSRRTAAPTDRPTRLHLVGGSTSPAYSFALERFVAALGLEDAVEITGSVERGSAGRVLPRGRRARVRERARGLLRAADRSDAPRRAGRRVRRGRGAPRRSAPAGSCSTARIPRRSRPRWSGCSPTSRSAPRSSPPGRRGARSSTPRRREPRSSPRSSSAGRGEARRRSCPATESRSSADARPRSASCRSGW